MQSDATVANLGRLFRGIAESERDARLREMRAVAMLLCGAKHPLTRALERAIIDPGEADGAIAELATLPALQRRRVLATIAALLP
jgi:hypothetical protein